MRRRRSIFRSMRHRKCVPRDAAQDAVYQGHPSHFSGGRNGSRGYQAFFSGRLRQGLAPQRVGCRRRAVRRRRQGGHDCQGQLTKLSAAERAPTNDVASAARTARAPTSTSTSDLGQIKINPGGEMCARDADLKGQTLNLYVKDITVKGITADRQQGCPDRPQQSRQQRPHHFKGERPRPCTTRRMRWQPIQPCPIPTSGKDCSSARAACCGCSAIPERLLPVRRDRRGGKVSWTYLSQPAGDPCRFGPNFGAGSPVTNEGCSYGRAAGP